MAAHAHTHFTPHAIVHPRSAGTCNLQKADVLQGLGLQCGFARQRPDNPSFCRNDVPVSYSEEQQAICTVQLVRPRPGVFAEAIQHLLVVCTTTEVRPQARITQNMKIDVGFVPLPGTARRLWHHDNAAAMQWLTGWHQVEHMGRLACRRCKIADHVLLPLTARVRTFCRLLQIVLLGVACGPGPSGQGDAHQELSLQPLPAFAVPSDNVIMTCAAGTRRVAGCVSQAADPPACPLRFGRASGLAPDSHIQNAHAMAALQVAREELQPGRPLPPPSHCSCTASSRCCIKVCCSGSHASMERAGRGASSWAAQTGGCTS